MTTRSYFSRSQVIESVRVCSSPKPIVFVITHNPALIELARDFLRPTNAKVSIVWMTSLESVCSRLEWDRAAIVIVDHLLQSEATDETLAALKSAAPETRVMVFAEHSVLP